MTDHLKSPVVICVDLDGTLINTDLLLESFLLLLKRNPLYLLLMPYWLLGGKSRLKAELARRIMLNPSTLPYNVDFLAWLREQRALGKKLWLCSASNERLVQSVADYLQIFQGVCASSEQLNLSGENKAVHLVAEFAEQNFDYCGNHHVDLAVWQCSQGAIVVNGSQRLTKKVAQIAKVRKTFPPQRRMFFALMKEMRLYQWSKNILIFIPLLAAHQFHDALLMQQAVLAFFAFGLCASSVYLLNDMLDLQDDRLHPIKCQRPFAAGELSLLFGFVLIPSLLIGAALLTLLLPDLFALNLLAYYMVTVVYSLALKNYVIIDTIALAGLYTLRLTAGAFAVKVELSFWLLLFSVFLFFSLALVKRYAELHILRENNQLKATGRGYHVDDLPILFSLGAASGYLGVLVLALYINSPEVESLYRYPQLIWGLCILLLYWVSRVWFKAHRGEMNEDPIIFALHDKVSLFVGLLSILIIMMAM